MAKVYYTLAIREYGIWAPQFGDWDRETVEQELEEYAGHPSVPIKRSNMKIVTSGAKQADIIAAIAKLNGKVPEPVVKAKPAVETAPAIDYMALNKRVAALWIQRRDALGLKGKKADDAALDFVVGLAQGCGLAGNADLERHYSTIAVMIVSVRGSLGLATLGRD